MHERTAALETVCMADPSRCGAAAVCKACAMRCGQSPRRDVTNPMRSAPGGGAALDPFERMQFGDAARPALGERFENHATLLRCGGQRVTDDAARPEVARGPRGC